jgi:alpha-N-arabinofuranosidase
VNVIAPIMTAPGGAAWRQTIYYPFKFASLHGRGTALRLDVDSPAYDADIAADVSYLDIAGVHDGDAGTLTFFAINRSADEALEVDLAIEHFGDARSVEHMLIKHDDLRAKNTEKMPNNVVPTRTDGARKSQGGLALILPPLSYSMIRVQL